MSHRLAIVVASLLMAACGGGSSKGSPARTVSCLFAGDTCDNITAAMSDAQQTSLQTACTNAGGAFAAAACTTTGTLAGHCHYTQAAVLSYTGIDIAGVVMDEYFFPANWTSLQAQTWCGDPPAGTWVP